MKQIVFIVVAFLLAGCSELVEVKLSPTIKVHVSQDSDVVLELTNDDKAYQALAQWLVENKDDWMVTNGKYPGGVYVQSGDTGIQVTKQFVILYSMKDGKLQADFIQQKTKVELAVLTALGNSE